MIDPVLLKRNLNLIYDKLKKKNFVLDVKTIQILEKKRKKLQIKIERIRFLNNLFSKKIGKKKILHKNCNNLIQKVFFLNKKLKNKEKKFNNIIKKIHFFLKNIPNIPDQSVPTGKDETNNVEIFTWGKIPKFNFPIKDHIELGEKKSAFNWEAARKTSGKKFLFIKGDIALLHRALGQFMLDLHVLKHDYIEYYVPYIVNEHAMYSTGQLPKFKEDLYHVYKYKNKNKKKKTQYLIPTAEVPITNLVQNNILTEDLLPIKITAKTPCFRSENTSYGKNVKGLIRMHQFEKVEIVQITTPEKSMHALEKVTSHAEKVLQMLKLPYRKVLLCSGELGFASAKTYDLEVWFPYINAYKEVSSCSNMLDFQSRRMKARFRDKKTNKIKYLHTINGSGLAVGRILAAILENYQCLNGNIKIPKVLQKKYMNGLKIIN